MFVQEYILIRFQLRFYSHQLERGKLLEDVWFQRREDVSWNVPETQTQCLRNVDIVPNCTAPGYLQSESLRPSINFAMKVRQRTVWWGWWVPGTYLESGSRSGCWTGHCKQEQTGYTLSNRERRAGQTETQRFAGSPLRSKPFRFVSCLEAHTGNGL